MNKNRQAEKKKKYFNQEVSDGALSRIYFGARFYIQTRGCRWFIKALNLRMFLNVYQVIET